jgi:hypothetical protein
VVSAIGIVPVPLYLLSWNGNVFSVFSTFCVNVAVYVLDLSRVAVRLIATANGGIIRHVPCCIKLFVQKLILWRVVAHSLALPIFLGLDPRRQQATKTAP